MEKVLKESHKVYDAIVETTDASSGPTKAKVTTMQLLEDLRHTAPLLCLRRFSMLLRVFGVLRISVIKSLRDVLSECVVKSLRRS